jgi:two-component system alkaline phosphatase synthesis response regulator PhoP
MSKRILYIEDHEDTRELVTIVLQEYGREVISDDSWQGAMIRAVKEKFDLYMLDSWLKDGSGLDLCKKLREFDRQTPILFLSAAAFDSYREKALQAGAQAYLTKPCNFSELGQLVAHLMNGA